MPGLAALPLAGTIHLKGKGGGGESTGKENVKRALWGKNLVLSWGYRRKHFELRPGTLGSVLQPHHEEGTIGRGEHKGTESLAQTAFSGNAGLKNTAVPSDPKSWQARAKGVARSFMRTGKKRREGRQRKT